MSEEKKNWEYYVVNLFKYLTDWVVDNIEHIIAKAVPLLSPLPAAFAVIGAMEGRLSYPWLAGGVVEAMGLFVGMLIGYIRAHNAKSPTKINERIGWALFGFYLFVVLFVIGSFKVLPAIVIAGMNDWSNESVLNVVYAFVLMSLPGLTLVGSLALGLRENIDRIQAEERLEREKETDREQEIEDDEREIKRIERLARLAAKHGEGAVRLALGETLGATSAATSTATSNGEVGHQGETMSHRNSTARQHALRAAMRRGEKISPTEFGRKFGVDRKTIQRDIREIESSQNGANGDH